MKKIIPIISALALCVSLTACSSRPADAFSKLEFVDASETLNMIRHYDLASLEKFSDIAVIGCFTDDPTQQVVNSRDGLFSDITSFNNVEVTQVIFGDVKVGDRLKVAQSYGVLDDKLISFSKLTPMQKGDEWIFFLTALSGPDVVYWCTGDCDGRYPTKNSSENGLMSLSEAPELGVYDENDFNRAIYGELIKKYGI